MKSKWEWIKRRTYDLILAFCIILTGLLLYIVVGAILYIISDGNWLIWGL